jgi:hypothetical protein
MRMLRSLGDSHLDLTPAFRSVVLREPVRVREVRASRHVREQIDLGYVGNRSPL